MLGRFFARKGNGEPGVKTLATLISAGHDVRPRGENLRLGAIAVPAGSELTPALLGVLATVKAAQLAVFAPPRVAILATGDELEALGDPLDPQRIPDANSYTLLGQCQVLAVADGLLVVPADRSGFAAGESATVQLLDATGYQDGAGF